VIVEETVSEAQLEINRTTTKKLNNLVFTIETPITPLVIVWYPSGDIRKVGI